MYEPAYKRNKKRRAALDKEHAATAKKLKLIGEATMGRWNEAVKMAQTYFSSAAFQNNRASRQALAKQIVEALRAPAFDFDRDGWNKFYSVSFLGRLDPRHRDKVWKQQKRLKTALRKLVAEGESVLPRVVDKGGDLHVSGAGLNASWQYYEWV